jgi:hypothetical protein
MLCTVDLLIKVACFVKKKNIVSVKNALISTSQYKEVNGTDPSSKVRIPWFTSGKCYTSLLFERKTGA